VSNHLPPHRKLRRLRLVGKDAFTQIEAFALLHAIGFLQAGDWMKGFRPQEIRALESAKRKLFETNNIASRRSIPKGLRERPANAETIWDVPTPYRMVPGWLPYWKPVEESKTLNKGKKFGPKMRAALRRYARQGMERPASPVKSKQGKAAQQDNQERDQKH